MVLRARVWLCACVSVCARFAMNVDESNFVEAVKAFEASLAQCEFVAMDLEMTRITAAVISLLVFYNF